MQFMHAQNFYSIANKWFIWVNYYFSSHLLTLFIDINIISCAETDILSTSITDLGFLWRFPLWISTYAPIMYFPNLWLSRVLFLWSQPPPHSDMYPLSWEMMCAQQGINMRLYYYARTAEAMYIIPTRTILLLVIAYLTFKTSYFLWLQQTLVGFTTSALCIFQFSMARWNCRDVVFKCEEMKIGNEKINKKSNFVKSSNL